MYSSAHCVYCSTHLLSFIYFVYSYTPIASPSPLTLHKKYIYFLDSCILHLMQFSNQLLIFTLNTKRGWGMWIMGCCNLYEKSELRIIMNALRILFNKVYELSYLGGDKDVLSFNFTIFKYLFQSFTNFSFIIIRLCRINMSVPSIYCYFYSFAYLTLFWLKLLLKLAS